MTPPIDAERLQQIIPITTTEHFTLRTGRGSTIAEANGRVTVIMSTVSSTLVALAFIGQISRPGSAFHVFSMVAVVKSIIAGVFFGLLPGTLFLLPRILSTIVGALVFALTVPLHEVYHRSMWAGIENKRVTT